MQCVPGQKPFATICHGFARHPIFLLVQSLPHRGYRILPAGKRAAAYPAASGNCSSITQSFLANRDQGPYANTRGAQRCLSRKGKHFRRFRAGASATCSRRKHRFLAPTTRQPSANILGMVFQTSPFRPDTIPAWTVLNDRSNCGDILRFCFQGYYHESAHPFSHSWHWILLVLFSNNRRFNPCLQNTVAYFVEWRCRFDSLRRYGSLNGYLYANCC